MNETIRSLIDEYAADIRTRLSGGMLYGELIEINDKNSCIVAAYTLGQTEGSKLGYVKTSDRPSIAKPDAPKPENYTNPISSSSASGDPLHSHFFAEPDHLSETRGPLTRAIDRLLLAMAALYVTVIIVFMALLICIAYALSK